LNFARLRERGWRVVSLFCDPLDSRLLSRLGRPVGRFNTELLGVLAGAEAPPLWEEIWPGRAMKLVGLPAVGLPGLRLGFRLALALEIEGHCSADEILQGRLIDLFAFVDVDGAPDIPVEAGVE
jgi:hypothetical protein